MMLSSDTTAAVAPAVAAWLVEHCALARGFGADTLARVAVIVALNAHGLSHAAAANAQVYTLFDVGSKFAHSCDPNAFYRWSEGVLTHETCRDVPAGAPLTVYY